MKYSIAEVFSLMIASLVIGFMINMFVESIKRNKSNKNKEVSEDFLIEAGILQFNLLGERAGIRGNVWKKRLEKEGVSVEIFKTYLTILPILFSNTFLGKKYWTLHVTGYNHSDGWFDIILKRRRKDDVKLRLHYLDITVFIEACNKVIGFNMEVTNYLSGNIIKNAKEIKAKLTTEEMKEKSNEIS